MVAPIIAVIFYALKKPLTRAFTRIAANSAATCEASRYAEYPADA
jgi:hypothetical protein